MRLLRHNQGVLVLFPAVVRSKAFLALARIGTHQTRQHATLVYPYVRRLVQMKVLNLIDQYILAYHTYHHNPHAPFIRGRINQEKQRAKINVTLHCNLSFFRSLILSFHISTLIFGIKKNTLHGDACRFHVAVGTHPTQQGDVLLQEHEKAADKEELEQRSQK